MYVRPIDIVCLVAMNLTLGIAVVRVTTGWTSLILAFLVGMVTAHWVAELWADLKEFRENDEEGPSDG